MLMDMIRAVGFKDGLRAYSEMYIKWPIQQFVWLNITHRPYCTYHGYGSCDKECNAPKLTTKKEIIAHWKEGEKEMRKVEVGKDGKCVYCGEFKGMVKIPDPNPDGLGYWLVCETCKKTINAQQKLSVAMMAFELAKNKNDETMQKIAQKEMLAAKAELDFIAAESFTDPFTMTIRKKEQ